MTNRTIRTVFTLAFTLAVTSAASAQATRTWVSGVGDDANPCSRTAPCATFAGTIDKTAPKGEINVLDPGEFGPVTITKSLTINGNGFLAGVQSTCGNGITINAGSEDVVKLVHLQISGRNSGQVGIEFNSGAALIVDDVTVEGFATGIKANAGATVVDHSLITNNSDYGVHTTGGSLAVKNSMLVGNNVGAQASGSATLRLSNTGIYNNTVAMGCGGGTILSVGDNRKGGNKGGTVASCSPSGAVTVF